MNQIVTFVVEGAPMQKDRPRVMGMRLSRAARAALGGRAISGKLYTGFRMYSPRTTADYEALIRSAFQEKAPAGWDRDSRDKSVVLTVMAFMPLPKSAPGWKRELARAGRLPCLTYPDWDNLGKAVSDALRGVAYHDDRQVCRAVVVKSYGAEPMILVTVEQSDPPRREEGFWPGK